MKTLLWQNSAIEMPQCLRKIVILLHINVDRHTILSDFELVFVLCMVTR